MRARSLGGALGVLLKYDLADNADTQFWPGYLARASQDQDLPLYLLYLFIVRFNGDNHIHFL